MSVREDLVQEVKKREWNLASVALALSQLDMPSLSPAYAKLHLLELERKIKEECPDTTDIPAFIQGLHETVFVAGKYETSSEEKTSVLNLIQTAQRRKAHPLLLLLLYWHLCRVMKVESDIVSFSGYLVLEILSPTGQKFMVDVSHRGRLMQTGELTFLMEKSQGNGEIFSVLSPQDFLLRMQSALKQIYFSNQNMSAVLRTVQNMLLIAPLNADLWKEDAVLEVYQNNLKQAVLSLETYLAFKEGESAEKTLLSTLKKALN